MKLSYACLPLVIISSCCFSMEAEFCPPETVVIQFSDDVQEQYQYADIEPFITIKELLIAAPTKNPIPVPFSSFTFNLIKNACVNKRLNKKLVQELPAPLEQRNELLHAIEYLDLESDIRLPLLKKIIGKLITADLDNFKTDESFALDSAKIRTLSKVMRHDVIAPALKKILRPPCKIIEQRQELLIHQPKMPDGFQPVFHYPFSYNNVWAFSDDQSFLYPIASFTCAAVSPQRENVVFSYEDSLVLYSHNGIFLHKFGTDPDDTIQCVIYHPRRNCTIGTGSSYGAISLWNTVTGQLLHSFEEESGINSISFDPRDGKEDLIMVGMEDGSIALYNQKENRLIQKWRDHARKVSALIGSQHGAFYSGSHDGSIKMWYEQDNACRHHFNTFDKADCSPIIALRLNQNETLLAAGRENGIVLLYDTNTHQLRSILSPSKHHSINRMHLSFSDDGSSLAAHHDGELTIWRVSFTALPSRSVRKLQLAAYLISNPCSTYSLEEKPALKELYDKCPEEIKDLVVEPTLQEKIVHWIRVGKNKCWSYIQQLIPTPTQSVWNPKSTT